MAELVRAELRALGAEVSEDGAAAAIGGRLRQHRRALSRHSPGGTPIVLLAHLDTVPVTGPIEVELVDGHLRNAHPTILGGDDKSAVAVMIEAMRRVRDEGLPHAGSSWCSPRARRSACAARRPSTCPRSSPGWASSSTTPARWATWWRRRRRCTSIQATFIGRAAHAGIAPEAGHSAIEAAARAIGRMPLGRIDAETTANVGTVAGGTATNVVAERCEILAETRSRDEQALAVQFTAMLDALTWAASECEVDLETRVDREFTAYRV